MRRVLFDSDPIMQSYHAKSLNQIVEDYQQRKEKLIFDFDQVVYPFANP